MTRATWFPVMALFLAAALAITGFVPRDAAAGILPLLVPSPAGSRLVPTAFGEEGGGEAWNGREPDASWRSRARILLLILVILVVLVYRYLAGWKPTISMSSCLHRS